MMLCKLNPNYIDAVMHLFCTSFMDDPYYIKMFPNRETRFEDMDKTLRGLIAYCINRDKSFCIIDGDKLIGFILCIDYNEIRKNDRKYFNLIYTCKEEVDILPYQETLHNPICQLDGEVIACVAVVVDEEYRRKGIASSLWDTVMESFPDAHFVVDVSNESSLEIYKRRGFTITKLDDDYFFACK